MVGGSSAVVERFFTFLSSRRWDRLETVLSEDVERVGPFGDRLSGRKRYMEFLAGAVPEDYGNDLWLVAATADGAGALARVTEHLGYPERQLDLEEAYAFRLDGDGLISRIEIFWQTPELDPGGFGSASSVES